MSLSVLNNVSAIYAQNYLNQTQASLQTVLQQLSSGSRINSGADDAAGLAVVNGLQANEAALTQSAQNATNGIGLLQTADGALAQVTNLLNRAVTLATEAANSTLSPTQVSSANTEYQNILSEIGLIGSTTNFSGNQVFTNTQTNLFVSDGSATGASSFNDTVGILGTSSVGETASTSTPVTSTLTPAAGATAGTPSASTATYTFGTGAEYTGDTLTGSAVISLGSGTAATIATGGSAAQFLTNLQGNSTLLSEGISATLSGGDVITLSGPTNGVGGSLVITSTVADSTAAGNLTYVPPSTASSGGATETLTLSQITNTINGTLSIAVAGGTANKLTVAAGTTGSELANQINSNSSLQSIGVAASFNSNVLTISGPSGASNTLAVTGTLAQTTVIPPAGGVDFASSSISTLTSSSAAAVLTSVTQAIGDVAYQRGILGANINQLTAASNVANAEQVNLTSASNAIQATNYGQATSDLAKYEVLSQTGISALAQANTVQQEILKLLQ